MRRSRPNNPNWSLRLGGLLLLFLPLFLYGACTPLPGKIQTEESDSGLTGVRGLVLRPDRTPAANAFVYAYRSASQGLRGPADFGARVDSSGHYVLDLVEGEYHLVARLRQSGADAGPPRPGDAWSIHPGNPVRVGREQLVEVDFTLRGGAVPRQVRQGSLTTGDTGFSGRLVDEAGEPFSGAFVLAYRTADFHRMPDLTSAPADHDGRFTLFVPEPAEYCLAARTKTRGQPRAGEMYGTLGRDEDSCRVGHSGQILDVGIIVLKPYR